MKRQRREITAKEALLRAADICARAEHCTEEIRRKLRLWQISESDADKIMGRLHHDKYIDDARYARAVVRDKILMSRWGKRKVEQALWLKRVDSNIIKEALSEIDEETYTENLRHVLQAKLRTSPTLAETYEGRTKLYRYAVGRGYEPDLASRILKEILTGH